MNEGWNSRHVRKGNDQNENHRKTSKVVIKMPRALYLAPNKTNLHRQKRTLSFSGRAIVTLRAKNKELRFKRDNMILTELQICPTLFLYS